MPIRYNFLVWRLRGVEHVITCFTSGSKGGTGKTTLSSLLALGCSAAGYRALLVDACSEGGATTSLLGGAPGPYLRDVLEGSAQLVEAVQVYSLPLGEEELDFYLLPNRGPLPSVSLEGFVEQLRRLADKYFDLVLIDMPAYQDPWYEEFLQRSDVVVKVVEPNPAAVAAGIVAWPPGVGDGDPLVVYALNQPRPYPKSVVKEYLDDLRRRFGKEAVVTVPYDYAASRVSPEMLGQVLSHVSDEFQDALYELAQRIIRPREGAAP